jgi:TolA-binding protein
MLKPRKSLIKTVEKKSNLLTFSEKAQLFYEQYARQVTYGLIGLVIVVGGWFGYRWMQQSSFSKADYAEMIARDEFAKGNYDDALQKVDAIIADYSSAPAAGSAMLMKGRIHESRSELDMAVQAYEKLIRKYGDQPYLAFSAKYALGAINNGRGDYEKAARYYRQAAQDLPEHFYAPQALLDAGRAYRKINKRDDAKAMFRLIITKYAKAREATDARTELAELDFNS